MVTQVSFNQQEARDIQLLALDATQVEGAKDTRQAQARKTQGVKDKFSVVPAVVGTVAGVAVVRKVARVVSRLARLEVTERAERREAGIAERGLLAATPVSAGGIPSAIGELKRLNQSFVGIRNQEDAARAVLQLQDLAVHIQAQTERTKTIITAGLAGRSPEAALQAGLRAFFNVSTHLVLDTLQNEQQKLHNNQREDFKSYQVTPPLFGG